MNPSPILPSLLFRALFLCGGRGTASLVRWQHLLSSSATLVTLFFQKNSVSPLAGLRSSLLVSS